MYNNKDWKIYIMENLLNGMIYIGKTDGSVDDNIRRELTKPCLLGKHVHDFGMDSFKVTVLEDGLDDVEVLAKRLLYIKKYNCIKPRGNNDTLKVKKCY